MDATTIAGQIVVAPPHSVIVIRGLDDHAKDHLMDTLSDTSVDWPVGVAVLFMSEDGDVSALDESAMAELGWVRANVG
jgi:hypothetical protein